MGLGIPIIDAVLDLGGKVADKLWMNKGEKEKLEFDKEQFVSAIKVQVLKLNQDGELEKIKLEFQESQAQRDYASNQFGDATILKDFYIGKIILLGRASIRWVITGFAMWQCHRIITYVLSTEVIQSMAQGKLSHSATWLISLVVCMVIGIPLFYVAGISIEKLFKARGVI